MLIFAETVFDMTHLIDSDKLIAEIERLKDGIGIGLCEYDAGEENGKMEILIKLSSFITSLQQEQPEVDLEKDIERYYYDNFAFISSVHIPTLDILTDIAKHFYELGRGRKEE